MNLRTARFSVLLAIGLGAIDFAQTPKGPFTPVPISQRAVLAKRLTAYTNAFRNKDWSSLYDLVSDENKIRHGKPVFDPKTNKVTLVKVRVSRRAFVRDMQGTDGFRLLIKFAPVRTDVADGTGDFNIYGCGVLPSGDEKFERIVAVRAVHEHDDWYFTNWDYPDPPEECSHLSDPAWKPARYLQKLDEPMSQVSCELEACEL